MKRFLYLLLLIFTACSMAKRQPEWIVERPYNNEYYIAIVKVPRKAPNYVELARNNAILEISTQISVQIDSDIALKETEENGIPSSEIISRIRSSSKNILKDLQLVGTYETKNDYWAYYRLSKSEYSAWRKAQCNQAMAQALNLLADFDSSTSNIASGIASLLHGLELIVDYTDMDLTTLYKGNEINLYNELFYRLNRLPENLSFKFATNEIDIVAKQRERKTVSLSVSCNKNGQEYPCSNFPLCFNFSSGTGEIIPQAITDENGKAELIINRITSFSNPQFIEAKPNKDFWLVGRENTVVKTMFNNLQFMPAVLKLNVRRPKAYLEYSFDNTPGTDFRNILVKKLQDLDLEVTENQNTSDYTFKVDIYNRSTNYLPLLNQYSATADAYIELLQTGNGKSIYNTNITGIKSTASLPEIARKMSELNAVNEICDKVMFMLVEQYIMF